MRRRLLFLTLVMVMLLGVCACGKKSDKEGFKPPIKGISWGMTRQDVLKDLDEAKYKVVDLDDSIHTAVILNDTIKHFGSDAIVYYLFSNNLCKDKEQGGRLQAVILRYNTISEDALLANMKDELGEFSKQVQPSEQVINYIWDSKGKISNLAKESYQAIKDFMGNSESDQVLLENQNNAENLIPSIEDPINAIGLKKITLDAGDTLSVTYYGDWAYLVEVLKAEKSIEKVK